MLHTQIFISSTTYTGFAPKLTKSQLILKAWKCFLNHHISCSSVLNFDLLPPPPVISLHCCDRDIRDPHHSGTFCTSCPVASPGGPTLCRSSSASEGAPSLSPQPTLLVLLHSPRPGAPSPPLLQELLLPSCGVELEADRAPEPCVPVVCHGRVRVV